MASAKKSPAPVPKKGSSGVGCCLKSLLLLTIGVLFLIFSPTLLDFDPRAPDTPFPATLDGPFAENKLLDKAELLFQGRLHGPESTVMYKGSIYTGADDGWIYRIIGDKLEPVVRIGRDCELPWQQYQCGRPLGLRVTKDGKLYIVDAYYGIYSYDLESGSLTRIFSAGETVEGRKIIFPDDMDIDESGIIYFSDASSKWDLSGVFYLIGDYDHTGRIIKYNPKTKKTEVLVDNLRFANGVQLSHDGMSLLFSEFNTRKIHRYYLKGPKKGQRDIFIDNLPGECDNVRASSRGGYWLGLSTIRNSTSPTITDSLGQYPAILRVLARLQHMVGSILVTLLDMVSPFGQGYRKMAYELKMSSAILNWITPHSTIVEVDKNGRIIRTLQSPSGKVGIVAEVGEHGGYLYLGSYCNPFLGRIKV